MMRKLHSLTGTINLRKTCLVQLRNCSIVTEQGKNNNNIETKWFLEKEEEILTVVNNSSVKQLARFIEHSLAKTIISNRKTDGSYKSLNELLSKNEIDSDILHKFYSLIIDHKMQRWKRKTFTITPDVKTIMIPKTILAIHVGPTAITWTLIDSNCKVLDCDCIVWRDQSSNVNAFDLISLASSIACSLPESSSYVIEEFQIPKKNFHPILSSQQQMTIAISSCLKLIEKRRKNNSSDNLGNSIYILRPLASARFFNLVLGREVIASEYVIKEILNDAETNIKELQDVYIDDELKKRYINREPDYIEQMGWSLLKAVTFARLVPIFNANVSCKSSV
ncbi:uncharacterized protein LOC108628400 [Ceratina calcarata]|uniref:Uncharacterized protein LOC108628400 n=1 Tax=Ceratina calcarata TaxID=156304 RepID=A0AAJ7J773_9HYME|nr:uncharacterized protein LOC108628400 [Ceratina calcarata]